MSFRLEHAAVRIGAAAPAGMAAAMVAMLVQGAGAQSADPTPIPSIGAQNRAQADMAGSIDDMCPQLLVTSQASVNQGGPGLTGTPGELLNACSTLAATAAVILGEDDPETQQFIAAVQDIEGFENFSFAEVQGLASQFGIPDDPAVYNGIIQQISGEEFQNGQSQIAEIRNTAASAIGARLAAVRAGATGFSVAGLGEAPAGMTAGTAVRMGQAGGGDLGEAFLGRFGGFASGRGTFGSKDATGEADGYDFTAPGLTLGLDYRLTDTVVVGGAFSYDTVSYDYDSTLSTASGQDLETDSYLFSLYATAAMTDRLFLEGIVSAGFAEHDSTRRVVIPGLGNVVSAADGDAVTARSDYDSTQYGFAIGGGYDIPLGGATITPLAQVEYIHAEIDGVRERGAGALDLAVSDHDIDSFTSQIGLQAGYPVSTGFGILQPYARAEWFHEFLGDNDGALISYANDVTVTDSGRQFSSFSVTTEDVDRDYGRITGGVTMTLPNGIVGFVEGSAAVGLDDFDIFTVEGGLRITF